MKARVLPPEEWSRVEDIPVPSILPYVCPEDIAVVVVEDKGKIVAAMSVLRMTHFEGVWIHPEHQNGGVGRSLLGLAVETAKKWAPKFVMGGAENEKMRTTLERIGGVKVPFEPYVLDIGGEKCRLLS